MQQPFGFSYFLFVLAIGTCVCAPASAQTVWDGTNNSWFDSAHWSAGVPNASTQAVINSGSVMIGAPGAAASSVDLSGPANHSELTFSNNATATGLTINMLNRNDGFIAYFHFDDTSSASNAIINIGGTNTTAYADGSLQFRDSSTAATATITTSNYGQVGFYGTSTAGSATITNNAGGFTGFQDNASAGTAYITNNAGGWTAFTAASSADQATVVNHAGGVVDLSLQSVENFGSGAVVIGSLSGAGNVYLGSTSLTLGGLNQNETISGVIADGYSSNMTLYINTNFGGYVAPPLTGGSLTKTGTGTLTLSGANTYTGDTTVESGTLVVNGSIASSALTTVQSSATLRGTGTVGNTQINSGGIFAPGSGTPGSSMNVMGNLAILSGAQYMVQVNAATSSFTNVTGTATLGGGTVNATFLPGSYVEKQYTIVATTDGRSGTFDDLVNVNLPSGTRSFLSYDANNAYLNLALDFTTPSGPGLNVNQQNVGNSLVNFFNTTGGIPFAFAGLTPAGLTQISGEIATGSQQTTFRAMDLFLGVITDPFVAGRQDSCSPDGRAYNYNVVSGEGRLGPDNCAGRLTNARNAYAAMYAKAVPPAPLSFEQRWSVWAAGYGGSQRTDGNAALGSNTATSDVYGVAVGADYRVSPDTLIGFALAGGGTNFSVAGGGSGRSDLFQAGIYARHNIGAAYITGALAYGWQDITTNRDVTAAGADHLRADFNANAFSGRVESGYRYATSWFGGLGLTPYAAGQFTTFYLPSYVESATSGSDQFALAYASKSATDTRSELGVRADKSFALNDVVLTVRGRAAWAHDFDPERSIGATFQTLPGASFVVNGAAQSPDSALVTAAVEAKWLSGWSLAGTFEGEFSNVTNSYAGKGLVRYAW